MIRRALTSDDCTALQRGGGPTRCEVVLLAAAGLVATAHRRAPRDGFYSIPGCNFVA